MQLSKVASSATGGQPTAAQAWTQLAGMSGRGSMEAQGQTTGAKAAVDGRAVAPVIISRIATPRCRTPPETCAACRGGY